MLPCQEQATMLATVISYASEILKKQTGRNTLTNRKNDSRAKGGNNERQKIRLAGMLTGWRLDTKHNDTQHNDNLC